MRIAVFHDLPSGGAKRALYEWTSRMSSDHWIDVYTLTTANHNFCDIRTFVHKHREFHFEPRHLFTSPFGRLNQLQRWLDVRELAAVGRQTASEIDQTEYDVVFVHPCRFTTIPALLAYVRTPAVYYLHEPVGPTFVRRYHRPYLERSRLRCLADRVDPFMSLYARSVAQTQMTGVRTAALLLSNSRFTASVMKREYAVDAPLCRLGVDTQAFQPISGLEKERYVLSVGELTPRKGFDFLVESLGLIPSQKRPPLRLLCNSEDPRERRYVEGLAADRGVDLSIASCTSNERMAAEYTRARLCLYAPVLEPFGMVPLEAMACGTPVVAVGEGGVSESLAGGQAGVLTERNPQVFAGAVAALIDDGERRARLARHGRDWVLHEWQWTTSTSALETQLRSVVRREATPVGHA
jgi:glycosyltransferase involved in cell wall biosynthesis